MQILHSSLSPNWILTLQRNLAVPTGGSARGASVTYPEEIGVKWKQLIEEAGERMEEGWLMEWQSERTGVTCWGSKRDSDGEKKGRERIAKKVRDKKQR